MGENHLLETCPMPDQKEVFYKKLRERDRMAEIQGPVKLKTHSSLERVYNTLKFRGSIENSIYEDSYTKSTNLIPIIP
jgi:hypothetical protein